MAVLAVVTFLVAVFVGVTMDRRGWSRDFDLKLRLLFWVVLAQLALTAVAPFVRTVPAFGGWILLTSASMGVGFPVAFALTIDFVPVRDRGYVAAAATGLTYFLANAVPIEWRIETFAGVMVAVMAPGAVVLGVLTFKDLDVFDSVSIQHREFGRGRFCRPTPVGTWSLAFWLPVLLMFGVFFVDSLGFLRIVDTPSLLLSSWQSPNLGTRVGIGVVHVLGAVVAGVLYTNFDRQWLFLLVFGFFAFTHLLYTFELRVAALFPALAGRPAALNPLVYAAAVSFYTTLNFALWPDLSTPDTIGTHAAIGFAGFFATFLSTAVALALDSAEVGLLAHLNLVNALALALFVGLAVLLYVGRVVAHLREGRRGEPS